MLSEALVLRLWAIFLPVTALILFADLKRVRRLASDSRPGLFEGGDPHQAPGHPKLTPKPAWAAAAGR
jgi:hypothetical protein